MSTPAATPDRSSLVVSLPDRDGEGPSAGHRRAMLPVTHVVVIVPAHDEQDRIAHSVRSIERSACAQPIATRLVVVLDSCTDRTRERLDEVESSRVDRSVVVSAHRCAASARQSGLESIGSRSEPNRIAVLSSDADTEVPVDWVARHVSALDSGLDAMTGVVELAPLAGEDIDVARWGRDYRRLFRADGSHPHVHAANLSVRLDVLTAVGGFGNLPRAEDIDLWKRLGCRHDVRVGSDHTLAVRTSHRLDGRVDGGFATALSRYSAVETAAQVEATPRSTNSANRSRRKRPQVESKFLCSE